MEKETQAVVQNAWLPECRLLPLLLFLIAFCSCEPAIRQIDLQGSTMGTNFSIKFLVPPGTEFSADKLLAHIELILAEVNRQMSTYIDSSEISQFNRHQGTDPMPVSREFANVVAEAVLIAGETDGALDITIGPLIDLWGFGISGDTDTLPSDDLIEAARDLCGIEHLKVSLEPPQLGKQIPGLRCSLSAIAKGYGVDVLSEFMHLSGIDNFMVEIGGEVRCSGTNQQNEPWRIGIEQADGSGDLSRVLQLRNLAVATSGDSYNYFEVDGVRYSHTIDPRNGWPVRHPLASVTVVHPSCMSADGYATALNVLGPEEGFSLALEKDMAVLMQVRSDTGLVEKMTPRLERHLAGLTVTVEQSPSL